MEVDKGTMTVLGRFDAKKLRGHVANKTRKKVDLVGGSTNNKVDSGGGGNNKQGGGGGNQHKGANEEDGKQADKEQEGKEKGKGGRQEEGKGKGNNMVVDGGGGVGEGKGADEDNKARRGAYCVVRTTPILFHSLYEFSSLFLVDRWHDSVAMLISQMPVVAYPSINQ